MIKFLQEDPVLMIFNRVCCISTICSHNMMNFVEKIDATSLVSAIYICTWYHSQRWIIDLFSQSFLTI